MSRLKRPIFPGLKMISDILDCWLSEQSNPEGLNYDSVILPF